MHENVPENPAMQAAEFNRIGLEFNALQSVLREVIDDCNTYFEG